MTIQSYVQLLNLREIHINWESIWQIFWRWIPRFVILSDRVFYLTFDRTVSDMLSHLSGISSGNFKSIWNFARRFLTYCKFWHSVWQMFWHSVWHMFRHPILPTGMFCRMILTFYLASYLAVCVACMQTYTVILCGILSEVHVWNIQTIWHEFGLYLRHILTPSYLLFGLLSGMHSVPAQSSLCCPGAERFFIRFP